MKQQVSRRETRHENLSDAACMYALDSMSIITDLAAAIDIIHQKHIAHLDICDLNVMIQKTKTGSSSDLSVKIIDFGSAQLFSGPEAINFAQTKEAEEVLGKIKEESQISRNTRLGFKKTPSNDILIRSDVGHVRYRFIIYLYFSFFSKAFFRIFFLLLLLFTFFLFFFLIVYHKQYISLILLTPGDLNFFNIFS